jgi:hypothetical protein
MNPVAPFKNLITTNKRQKVDAEDFLSDFFSWFHVYECCKSALKALWRLHSIAEVLGHGLYRFKHGFPDVALALMAACTHTLVAASLESTATGGWGKSWGKSGAGALCIRDLILILFEY